MIIQDKKLVTDAITKEKALQEFIIPGLFEEAFKKDHESIMINKSNLTDQIISKFKHRKFKKAKKISFMENNLVDLSNIINIFPAAEIFVLSKMSFI